MYLRSEKMLVGLDKCLRLINANDQCQRTYENLNGDRKMI